MHMRCMAGRARSPHAYRIDWHALCVRCGQYGLCTSVLQEGSLIWCVTKLPSVRKAFSGRGSLLSESSCRKKHSRTAVLSEFFRRQQRGIVLWERPVSQSSSVAAAGKCGLRAIIVRTIFIHHRWYVDVCRCMVPKVFADGTWGVGLLSYCGISTQQSFVPNLVT